MCNKLYFIVVIFRHNLFAINNLLVPYVFSSLQIYKYYIQGNVKMLKIPCMLDDEKKEDISQRLR